MKAPAFQFYPRDWDTDENVIPMTYEEEGVYFALCRRYWLSGGLPADLDRLRVLLKGRPSRARMEKWWVTISPCFQVEGDRLTHKRLDRERESQANNREQRKLAAEKRWAGRAAKDANASTPHMQTDAAGMQKQSTATASSSAPSTASSSATAVENAPASVLPMRRPRNMGALGTSPAQHTGHGRCNDRGVCLPQILYTEILGRFGNDVTRFDAFYNGVLDTMPDDYVPTGSVFRFWHDMLERAHPEMSAPKPSPRSLAANQEW